MSVKKLLQINVTANWGSTGKIAESIGLVAQMRGWEIYMAHGSRYVCRSQMKSIQIGSKLDEFIHFGQGLFLDNHGLASKGATKRFLEQVDVIRPDIVHLHNIHGYFLNYPMLFEYLKKKQIPVVWTLHDCWAFTGHCCHFILVQCEKWKKEGCHNCQRKSAYPKSYVDRSQRNYHLKKQIFSSLNKVVVVSVSQWLKANVDQSFLSFYPGRVIYNGIDTTVFKFTANTIKKDLGIEDKYLLIGVATAWSDTKGLKDYYKLAKILPSNFQIVLIGLSPKQIKELPVGIIGINRTNNQQELVQYYSAADIVLNLSYAETFGLTTVEGFACGTPSIVYNATASPELIKEGTGIIVAPGDIDGVKKAVLKLIQRGKNYYSANCRQWAEQQFDKTKCFEQYVELYNDLINNKIDYSGGG